MPSPIPARDSAAAKASGPASWNGTASSGSVRSAAQSRKTAPGTCPRANSCREVPSTRQRQSTMRMPGRDRFSATQSGSASSSGRANEAGTRPVSQGARALLAMIAALMVAPFLPDADKVRALRDAIPGAGAGIYLNTASAGPVPAEVDAAIRGVRDREVRVGRGDGASAEGALARRDEARAVIAALVGTPVDEIALTHGTLDGMATAVGAVPLAAGDVVLATDEEHPAVDRLIGALVRRRDVRVRRVPVDRERPARSIEAEFDDAVASGARLCLVPHVTWATGRRLPVESIAAAARAAGAWTIV